MTGMVVREFDLALYSALTPLHIGIGRAPGAVDLPVARDSFGFPFIPGSSIKGSVKSFCLRECASKLTKVQQKDLWENPCLRHFGWDLRLNETGAEEAYLSPISFTDAFLFLFPVKYETSEEVGFGYATSDMAINQIASMAKIVISDDEDHSNFKCVNPGSELYLNGVPLDANEVSNLCEVFKSIKLMEKVFNLLLDQASRMGALSLVKYLLSRSSNNHKEYKLFVVPSGKFKEVVEAGIMRMTRVRLDYVRKAVQKGALWTEEYVPQGTIFVGLVEYNSVTVKDCEVDPLDARSFLVKLLSETSNILDVGGKETIGKGLVYLSLLS